MFRSGTRTVRMRRVPVRRSIRSSDSDELDTSDDNTEADNEIWADSEDDDSSYLSDYNLSGVELSDYGEDDRDPSADSLWSERTSSGSDKVSDDEWSDMTSESVHWSESSDSTDNDRDDEGVDFDLGPFGKTTVEIGASDGDLAAELAPVYDTLPAGSIRLLSILPGDDIAISCTFVQRELKQGLEYTALSYAWGARPNTHTILLNGHCVSVRKNLYRFLREARNLPPQKLGLVWIDALCINQSSNYERNHQVALMAQIYRVATRVLVWLGPAYGGSDGAMDRLTRCRKAQKEKQTSSIRTTAAGIAIGGLCWRPYWRRLWILQEVVLARKICLMVGGKIANWEPFREMILQDLSRLESTHFHRFADSVELKLVRDSPVRGVLQLITQMEQYNDLRNLMLATAGQRCTEPRDRVYALLGIAAKGHEHIVPDYNMPVTVILNAILSGLYTHHPPKRLDHVVRHCEELTGLLRVDYKSMFQLIEGYGAFKPPSKGTLEKFTLGDVDINRELTIWWAAFYGHTHVEKMLLEDRNVNIVRHLKHAVEDGNERVMRFITERRAEAEALENRGQFDEALVLACGHSHQDFVKDLLHKGADVNARARKQTALGAAVSRKRTEIVELLIQHGADVNFSGRHGVSALQAACSRGYERIVELLIDAGAGINAPGVDSYGSALQAASLGGHEKIVKLLINRGADVNAPGGHDDFNTALEAASFAGHEKVMELLIRHGANVNAAGEKRYNNALKAASSAEHEKIATLLIQNGAEVNASEADDCSGSALQAAARKGHLSVAESLIRQGADVNASGGKFGTPLQAASFAGHEDVIETLLKYDADVNAKGTKKYGTALQAVVLGLQYRHKRLHEVQSERGPAAVPLSIRPDATKHLRVAKRLIAHGADVNATGEEIGSALSLAARYRFKTMAELLIANGAVGEDVKVKYREWLNKVIAETRPELLASAGKAKASAKDGS